MSWIWKSTGVERRDQTAKEALRESDEISVLTFTAWLLPFPSIPTASKHKAFALGLAGF